MYEHPARTAVYAESDSFTKSIEAWPKGGCRERSSTGNALSISAKPNCQSIARERKLLRMHGEIDTEIRESSIKGES